jgi:small-conductance mechanosensitive channel
MPALLQTPGAFVDLAQAAALFIASLAVLLLMRHFLLRWATTLARDPSSPASILPRALRLPSFLWCIAGAMASTLQLVELPGAASRWVRGGAVVFLVLSICVVTSNALIRVAQVAARRRGFTFGLSGVVRALIHVFVLMLGGTVLLRYFNITVAPLLATLGVGGLAIALALRDTLANFFAGIHILVEAPISIGEFIKLSSGEEGTVTDIGWRTTRVLTPTNNTVVIPNEKITSSILTNYALPDDRKVTEVVIVLALDADVRRAVQIAEEELSRTEGLVAEFAPVILFDPGVTPTHLQFKVIFHVAQRVQQGLIQSGLRLRLLDRYRQENIPLPQLPPELASSKR